MQQKTDRQMQKQKIISSWKQIRVEDGFKLYQYPIYQKTDLSDIQEYKTILMIGQTGTGKTTLINFFINYYLGVEKEDDFRVILIDETNKNIHSSQSQTQDVTIYFIKPVNGNHGLRIIDTPGFGDTRGIEQDQIIRDKIYLCFKNDVEYLTTVCFVVQASLNRLTHSQYYILDSLLQMFGKDVSQNFVFIFSHIDDFDDVPVGVEALKFKGNDKDQDSPVLKIIEKLSNPWYLKCNSKLKKMTKTGKEQWNLTFEQFSILVEKKIKVHKDVSIQLTKDVIKERETIINVLSYLRKKVQEQIQFIQEHESLYKKISLLEEEIISTQNHSFSVTKYKIEKKQIEQGKYVTNCSICNFTCHFPCIYSNDEDKINCVAMQDDKCTICEKKCSWKVHQNNQFYFETNEYQENVSIDKLKKQFVQSSNDKTAKKQILSGIENEYVEVTKQCFEYQNKLMKAINKLSEIALQPAVCTNQGEYINQMIQEEDQNRINGWQKRQEVLRSMKEDWVILSKLASNENQICLTEDYFKNKIQEKQRQKS